MDSFVFDSMDISWICREMNRCGRLRQPFLFGINFEKTDGFFIADPLQQQEVLFSFCGRGNGTRRKKTKDSDARPVQVTAGIEVFPVGYEAYKEKFDIIHTGLHRGDSFLTNLTVRTPITTSLTIDEIFNRCDSPYQLLVPGRFVCFSPERFVRIKDGVISTNPMKGTIDASVSDAEKTILNDFKEMAEHYTIVDLLRNDLSMVAREVHVSRFRYIDRICAQERELLQVSSEITGKLSGDYFSQLGDIITGLLPAGSVSGAPKSSTVRMIRYAEGEERGFYTGIAGYFDGNELDTTVLIRFIEQRADGLFFRSGGGITAYSNPEDEYREILEKIYLPVDRKRP